MDTIAIFESKKSEKVVKFATPLDMLKYCSQKQVDKILKAHENNMLWGVHFTKSGKIRATYI